MVAGAHRHVGLGAGFIAAGSAANLWQFSVAQGALIGFLGTSATFVPLVADTSQWFTRRRGIAVAICMSGNYAAGTVWPPILQHFIDSVGWRADLHRRRRLLPRRDAAARVRAAAAPAGYRAR